MTNDEIRARRKEAARKGAATRAAKAPAEGPRPVAGPEPVGPTARELIARAQDLGREADLWYHAHLGRWPSKPSAWTAGQRREAEAFLAGFVRPDGTAQPVPNCRRKAR